MALSRCMRSCVRRMKRSSRAGAGVGSAGGMWPNMAPADAGIPLPAIGGVDVTAGRALDDPWRHAKSMRCRACYRRGGGFPQERQDSCYIQLRSQDLGRRSWAWLSSPRLGIAAGQSIARRGRPITAHCLVQCPLKTRQAGNTRYHGPSRASAGCVMMCLGNIEPADLGPVYHRHDSRDKSRTLLQPA